MREQNETLIGLVEELAARWDTQFTSLLRYQHLLVSNTIPVPQNIVRPLT